MGWRSFHEDLISAKIDPLADSYTADAYDEIEAPADTFDGHDDNILHAVRLLLRYIVRGNPDHPRYAAWVGSRVERLYQLAQRPEAERLVLPLPERPTLRDFVPVARALMPMFDYLNALNRKRYSLDVVGRRAIAALWCADSALYDDKPLAPLSRCGGIACTRSELSKLACTFSAEFGIRNRGQRHRRRKSA